MRLQVASVALALLSTLVARGSPTEPLRVGMDPRSLPSIYVPGLDYSREDSRKDPQLTTGQIQRLEGFEVEVLHALSPVGRPGGRRIYYFLRNKIWISARYLPWPMIASQLLIWSGYFLKEAIRIGRIALFFAALGAGVAGIPARRRRNDRISRPALRRLAALDGRLYY